jgi:peptidylprolyl isomerase
MLMLAACAAIAIAGCGGDDSSTTAEAAAEAPELAKPEVQVPEGKPPTELQIEDLTEGGGDEAKAGDEVSVHYVGVNYKSGKQFDASWDRGESFSFELGAGMVIPGWDQGVEGMKVGGRRELIVPPELGYGSTGSPPDIPPNETLVFVIDLLEVR